MKIVKTYNDATLSGAPLVIKLQSALGLYAYIKAYPTISAALGATSDTFTTKLTALQNYDLSKDCIIGFITSGGQAFFTKAYRTASGSTVYYSGTIANLQMHLEGYLSGLPRVAIVYVNTTPYYFKEYHAMVSRVIADVISKVDQTAGIDALYISKISNPILNNFPLMTQDGELITSNYNASSFDLSGQAIARSAAAISAHESTYPHAKLAVINDPNEIIVVGTMISSSGEPIPISMSLNDFFESNYYNVQSILASISTATAMTAHLADTDNPHNVNKWDVGLSYVDNVSINSWAGSTNVTTLGKVYQNLTKVQPGEKWANSFTIRSSGEAKANQDVVNSLYIKPRGYFGSCQNTTLSGIVIGSPEALSGTPEFSPAMTIYASNCANNNWGLVHYGNAYFDGLVSAASFVDRTPDFAGDGIEALKNVKSKNGMINHKTLPKFAQKKIPKTFMTNKEGDIIGETEEVEGRGIGEMISVLVKAVQQLTERVEDLEKQLGGK